MHCPWSLIRYQYLISSIPRSQLSAVAVVAAAAQSAVGHGPCPCISTMLNWPHGSNPTSLQTHTVGNCSSLVSLLYRQTVLLDKHRQRCLHAALSESLCETYVKGTNGDWVLCWFASGKSPCYSRCDQGLISCTQCVSQYADHCSSTRHTLVYQPLHRRQQCSELVSSTLLSLLVTALFWPLLLVPAEAPAATQRHQNHYHERDSYNARHCALQQCCYTLPAA